MRANEAYIHSAPAEGYCFEHEGMSRGESNGQPWACDNWGRFPQLDCRIIWNSEIVVTSENRYDDNEDDCVGAP